MSSTASGVAWFQLAFPRRSDCFAVDALRAERRILRLLHAEPKPAESDRERLQVRAIGLGLVVTIVAAYVNSLSTPFVFDDPLAITDNPTLRQLWPITEVLFPPHGAGQTVEGRPVLNLTLALNYAINGTSVRGYHVVNVIVHALAALTLFGVMRRTLTLPRMRSRFGAAALPLATIVALLWSLHPLQTESVTYIVQRAESLMGLFYLLTLYCFIRAIDAQSCHAVYGSADRDNPRSKPTPGCPPGNSHGTRVVWFGLSTLACLVGMATKEVMVSAPVLVLVFDGIFVAGSIRTAWAQRWRVHLALFSTWLLLIALVIGTGTRGGTAGFGIGVTPWAYALTQCEAVTRYLGLSFWPHPLIFDYGVAWVQSAADVLPYAIVVAGVISTAVFAWWRWPAAAFLALLFFAVLSPTSSIVPGNRQTIAEHRMYLPLAAVITLAVCGVFLSIKNARHRRWAAFGGIALSIACGVLTARRNDDYRSELILYRDTVTKRPGNGFARYNLAKAWADVGRHADALPEYEASLRLMPDVAPAHYNLANSLVELGRPDAARSHFEAALKINPNYANAHFNLGNLLLWRGDAQGAILHFTAAIMLEPQRIDARENLGGVLLELRRFDEARVQFEQALRMKPDSAESHFGMGNLLLLQEHWADAAREFEIVVRLRPELGVARERLELARRNMPR